MRRRLLPVCLLQSSNSHPVARDGLHFHDEEFEGHRLALELLKAIAFRQEAVGGATLPVVMQCVDARGSTSEVYVKFSWQQCPPAGLVRELFGAFVARDLGLLCASPALVEIPDELRDLIDCENRPLAHRMATSVIPAFGSQSLGAGYRLCHAGAIPSLSSAHAAEVWAFDQLVLNPDRNQRKPNCLTSGTDIALIDHEKALNLDGVGTILCPAPWQALLPSAHDHIFFEVARNSGVTLDRLQNAWNDVLNNVSLYHLSIPATWNCATLTSEICEYLKQLGENLAAAFRNLREITS